MDILEWYQQQPAAVKAAIISGIFMLLNRLLAALLNSGGAWRRGERGGLGSKGTRRPGRGDKG